MTLVVFSPTRDKQKETLATIRISRCHHASRPQHKHLRVIADKTYDRDLLRIRLRDRGIELICPYRKNRVRLATQDGRALRRYRRQWIVERTIGWVVWSCAMTGRCKFTGRSFISLAS